MHTFDTFRTSWINEPGASISRTEYPDGSTQLIIRTAAGAPLAIPTVCLADHDEHPADGHVFLKQWATPDPFLNELVAKGVVSEPVRELTGAWGTAFECALLLEDL